VQQHTYPLGNKFFETGFRRNKRSIAFLLPPTRAACTMVAVWKTDTVPAWTLVHMSRLCWTTPLRCAPFAKLQSQIWVKLECGSQISSGKCFQPVPIRRNWPQVSSTCFLLMASILLNRGTKKWPTSLRKVLLCSYQKTIVLLPSLFQVHQPVPAARNRETSIGEVLCHLLAAPDRKIRTLPFFPPIKEPVENGKVTR